MRLTSNRSVFGLAAVSFCLALPLSAQVTESPTPPKPGRYYSAQYLSLGTNRPPLPANPFPELPVYPLDEWNWAYDDREVDYEKLRSQAGLSPKAVQSFDRGAALEALGDCASELVVSPGSNTVTLTITNATADKFFDLFRTFALVGTSITHSAWQWMGRGSDGQNFTVPTGPCEAAFYVLGCTNDSDEDGLGDAFEALVGPDWPTNLTLVRECETFTLILTNLAPGADFDIFRTFDPLGEPITNSFWHWLARGTNGQEFTFPNCRCWPERYLVAGTNDTDGDQLSDAFEALVNKTSPTSTNSVNALYSDLEMVNVLVNDPEQDCGNEQNTQFETTCAVLGSNVIVGFVDSNRGVYGLGEIGLPYLTNRTPQLVAYALSRDGGETFEDLGVPPLSRAGVPTNDDGDAGDPVLAVDQASGIVYLVGTTPRNAGYRGMPIWKSTNAGVTFSSPIVVHTNIQDTDKPWIAVDNADGAGQHDVYLSFLAIAGTPAQKRVVLACSTDGSGAVWTNQPFLFQGVDTTNICRLVSPIVQVGPEHVAYVVWYERTGTATNGTNWLKLQTVRERGASTGEVQIVCQLVFTNDSNLKLKRSNTADDSDFFNVYPFPVLAVNPATNKAGHIYIAYADQGQNAGDKADVFFTSSTDGGTNWTAPVPINTVWTNDQWMPVLAVKPDGTGLFAGWYDRRNDTNNSLIDVYGRWSMIDTNGAVDFGSEFRMNTVAFSPVFSGTLTNNTIDGHYDPVYPPGNLNLHWWYPEWPDDPLLTTSPAYTGHVGEYNGAATTSDYVFMTWTDNRLAAQGTRVNRLQPDIRFIRLLWPD